MNNTALKTLINQLQSAAESLDCTLGVGLAPPAMPEAIEAVAAAVGGPLPESLVSFLRMHDGMNLLLTPNTPAAEALLHFPSLDIYGTRAIVETKVGVTDVLECSPFFDEPSAESESTKKKANRSVPIASVSRYNSQEQILFIRDEPQTYNEFAIIEAALDERQLWLQALDDDVALITIAVSFEDFLTSCIENVINGRPSFRYWNLKAAWVKYDGSPPEADAALF